MTIAMNQRKLKQLFASVRNEPLPEAPEHFESGVMRAIRRQSIPRTEAIFDQLARLCPRIAFAAGVAIVLFVAGDLVLTAFNLPGISDGLAQLSSDWLLTGNGLAL